MSVNKPTGWTWHGQIPTIFTETAWILVTVGKEYYGNRGCDKPLPPGEFSERVLSQLGNDRQRTLGVSEGPQ